MGLLDALAVGEARAALEKLKPGDKADLTGILFPPIGPGPEAKTALPWLSTVVVQSVDTDAPAITFH